MRRLAASLALLLSAGCSQDPDVELPWGGRAGHEADGGVTDFPVPPPPFSSNNIFPCMDCHRKEVPLNTTRRELDEHEQIQGRLHHGPRERWCFDCHNPLDRDQLRLAGDVLIPFSESYRLCGQCHGDKYRDWKVGVHGKRTGQWNGRKQYLLCASCHDPHAPRFQPLNPEPPPTPPALIR